MFTRYTAVLIIGLLAASYAFADYYRYRDQNGVLRFTDNLGEVPEAQRPKVKRYQDAGKGHSIGKQAPGKSRAAARHAKKGKTQNKKITEVQRLILEKQKLEQAYKDLMNEKMTLAYNTQRPTTRAQAAKLKKSARDLNLRIEKFEKRRYKYQQRAAVLSDQIQKEKQRQNRPKRVVGPPRKCGDSRLCKQ